MTGGAARATALAQRALAPDLARGLMLALIAVANAHLFVVGRPIGVRGYPVPTTLPERVVTLLGMLFVDGRAYPLFAALVGYGLVTLARRRPGVAGRRSLVLVAVGAVHGVLIFPGDIIGAYGLVGLVLAATLTTASSRALLSTAGVIAVIAVLLSVGAGVPQGGPSVPSLAVPSALQALGMRPGEWIPGVLFSALVSAPAVLVGAWVARAGVLDDPLAHRARLARWALLGLPLGALLGLPAALGAAGWWTPGPLTGLGAGAAHAAGGYVGALGWLGLLGVLATLRLPGSAWLAAAGTWSMTLYVTQSVAFDLLFPPWALGLGLTVGVTGAVVIALATWAVTVLVAGALARRGHRGPLELLTRRAAYGRT